MSSIDKKNEWSVIMGERTTSEWRIRVFMRSERHQGDQQELKEKQGTI